MKICTSQSPVLATTIVPALLPILAILFISFLVIGSAMPVLPLYVHQGLGLCTFLTGLVAGAQFAASLITRICLRRYAGSRAAKRILVAGLLAAGAAGLFYHLSLRFVSEPITSVRILLLGRALLGGAQGYIITGALCWGLAIGGPQNSRKVIVWIGGAMYVAFVVGALAGAGLYASYGFAAIALATTLIPLAALLLFLPLRAVAPRPHVHPAFEQVAGASQVPGIALALGRIGFAAIATLIAPRWKRLARR